MRRGRPRLSLDTRTASLAVGLSVLASLAGTSHQTPAPPAVEVVKAFEQPPRPRGPLVLGGDGALYGIADGGGSPDSAGSIFRVNCPGFPGDSVS